MAVQLGRRLLSNSLFRLSVTAALLAIVVWRSEPQRLAGSFDKLGFAAILIALVLTVPFLALKALRWQLVLRNGGVEASFGQAAVSLVGGMGLALVTPARLGEIARVAYLRDPRKLRLSALVLLDKLFDVLVLVLLSAAGAWVLISPLLGVVFAAVGLLGLAFTFRPQLFGPAVTTIERRLPLGGRTAEVIGSLETLGPSATAGYVLLTVASFAIVIAQFAIILHGPEPKLGLEEAALVFPIVILTNVIPLTIAGLGLREGASMLLLAHYGVAHATAAVAAFMMFFVNTAVPGIVGSILPVFRRRQRQAALVPPPA